MANVPACDVCGRVSPRGVLPPEVEPGRWSNAIADFTGTACRDCLETKPLAEIISHFEAGPGGVVEGADRGPYMVVHRPGDDEGAATGE